MNINWDDMQFVLAITRGETLSAAAKILGVSQPTVSRRLSAIETRYSVRLFDRIEGGYMLTPAGEDMFDTLQPIEEELTNLERRIAGRDSQLKGSLRLTCTEVMANLYLADHLARFIKVHPEIDLNLTCTFHHLSLSRSDADVAIRVTGEPTETLVGRHLVDLAVGVYIATDYPTQNLASLDPGELDWIGWRDEPYNRSLIQKFYPNANIRHRVDDMLAMRSMARAGLGVVILPCYVGDTDPGLRRAVVDTIQQDNFGLWVLSHPDVRRAARVRAFMQFIGDQIISDRDLFEGNRQLP